MAKITELTALTSVSSDDLFPVVNDPSGTPATQKVTFANIKTSLALVKADVGLGNVDNTADTAKPVSSAQQTAIDAKVADAINDATTTVAPSQNAVFDALALKAPLASPTFTGTVTIPDGTIALAKMANMATSSLIYRKTAGTGVPEVQTLATLKTDLGLTGTNSGDQTLPTDATISTSDITTNDVSTSKHGWVPKLPNDNTKFLNGVGAWTVPTASIAYTLVATLASDAATGANTTPISLSGLVFTYAINSTYRIWFMGRVSAAAATTGCGFQFDTSSAVTDISVSFYHQLANTGTLSGGNSIADDSSVGVSSGLPDTSTYPVVGTGIIRTTGNTGTAQLRFRSETTAVITAKAGLTLVVEKIA